MRHKHNRDIEVRFAPRLAQKGVEGKIDCEEDYVCVAKCFAPQIVCSAPAQQGMTRVGLNRTVLRKGTETQHRLSTSLLLRIE